MNHPIFYHGGPEGESANTNVIDFQGNGVSMTDYEISEMTARLFQADQEFRELKDEIFEIKKTLRTELGPGGKHESSIGMVSIGKASPRFKVLDAALVPERYKSMAPDRELLNAALISGEEAPEGTELIQPSPQVRLSRKSE